MNQNLKTLEDIIQKEFGVVGTEERKNFDEGFENFKLGKAIKEARIAKGLTQEKLAEKCGMDRHYISKIENDVKEVRISTLQKIIEVGLNAKLLIQIV
jgi:DNA-binding XRE family transcriptional regulator